MNKATEIVVGASVGAVASVVLELAIGEAKRVFGFDEVSQELASTMEDLLPIVKEIESMQDVGELKTLRDTIDKARVLVQDCSGVKMWEIHLKDYYSRRVEKINKKLLNFCQVQLQLINHKNVGENHTFTLVAINNCVRTICERIDRMDVRPRSYTKLSSVPKLNDKVHIGMDWPLIELRNKVLDDSLDKLLVSAPPGCGKTTLVTQLCHDQKIKDKFNHICYSVVSSNPNFRVIVQNLLQHNGYEAVTFENDPQAANALVDLIEELREGGPVLFVLDDVWRGGDDFLKYFRIKLPDAKALLVHVAPCPCNASQADYEEVIQKILKRCNGLPLLIEVLGVPLKDKGLFDWRCQVESWSEKETILDDVLQLVQPSFTALKPHLKECFMDMGSFLEDQKIRASVLIDIWVELYGKGTSTSRDFAYMKYLNDLASQNLLNLIPLGRKEHEDGFYNQLVVTQHDVLRELAIHESKQTKTQHTLRELAVRESKETKTLHDALRELAIHESNETKRLTLVIQGDNYPDDLTVSQRESARFLSISTDDLFSSSWVEMNSFQFPNVEALLLNISSSNYALPSFIATMKKLKVVIIINHGPYPATLTNLSCLSSLPKLKRIRLEKVSITFLDILKLQLGSLEKLSLFMCCLGEVSHDKNEIDVSRALSKLQEIDLDYCYDLGELPNWISEAVSLEKLSITNCHKLSKLPEAIGGLSKLKFLRLSSCIILSELPQTTARLSNLQFLDISHCLGLRKLPIEIGRLQKLKKIYMSKCSKCELPDSVRNLENLEVKCDEEIAVVLWEGLKPKMKYLTVQVEETEHNLNLLRLL
ncbi:Powdery mildew resistance protein [Hirschfeldia incana]|nr:Powdery mildew resistance protein [Hirschfeldia incana]